jgi:hypothetical protein
LIPKEALSHTVDDAISIIYVDLSMRENRDIMKRKKNGRHYEEGFCSIVIKRGYAILLTTHIIETSKSWIRSNMRVNCLDQIAI